MDLSMIISLFMFACLFLLGFYCGKRHKDANFLMWVSKEEKMVLDKYRQENAANYSK